MISNSYVLAAVVIVVMVSVAVTMAYLTNKIVEYFEDE